MCKLNLKNKQKKQNIFVFKVFNNKNTKPI